MAKSLIKVKLYDHLITKRHFKTILPFDHHGVYLGKNKVLHYGRDENYKLPVKVQIISLESFNKHEPLNLLVIPHHGLSKVDIKKRIKQSLGKGIGKFDFKKFNCEHFSNWILEGGDTNSFQSKVKHGFEDYKKKLNIVEQHELLNKIAQHLM